MCKHHYAHLGTLQQANNFQIEISLVWHTELLFILLVLCSFFRWGGGCAVSSVLVNFCLEIKYVKFIYKFFLNLISCITGNMLNGLGFVNSSTLLSLKIMSRHYRQDWEIELVLKNIRYLNQGIQWTFFFAFFLISVSLPTSPISTGRRIGSCCWTWIFGPAKSYSEFGESNLEAETWQSSSGEAYKTT